MIHIQYERSKLNYKHIEIDQDKIFQSFFVMTDKFVLQNRITL